MSVFSFVMDQVEDVVNQVVQQANQASDVSDNIGSVVEGVVGGGSWAGQSADAFHEEITTRLLPEIAALIASIMGFSVNIGGAQDLIQQADSQVSSVVGGLTDVFQGIF